MRSADVPIGGVTTEELVVALTFDDGPGDWTGAMLDLLGRHGAFATFFVLGEALVARTDVARRAVRDGHELGNHTWSHRRPSTLADDELRSELERTQGAVERATGVAPTFARPPYGDDAERFARVAAGLGLVTLLWSVDPEDWREPSAGEIVERTLSALHPGAVVDLHDGFRRGSTRTTSQATVEALAALLPALAERGYRCVTASALLTRGRPM